MLATLTGDITKHEAQVLVNTVNRVGVMGRGVALDMKTAFPEIMPAYQAACSSRRESAFPYFHKLQSGPQAGRYVAMVATKRHWRDPSTLEDVAAQIDALYDLCKRQGVTSIAIPPLGCGLGGLDWAVVRPMIAAKFEADPDVTAYVPDAGAQTSQRRPGERPAYRR